MVSRYMRCSVTSLAAWYAFSTASNCCAWPVACATRGLLVALAGGNDAGGVATGARHDVVAVGLGLVAHALGVGVGALHVAEAFDHRRAADRRSAAAPG